MTVPPPAPEIGDLGPAIFEPLTVRELDQLDGLICAALRTVAMFRPLFDPLRGELRDVQFDLRVAWVHSYRREYPDGQVITA